VKTRPIRWAVLLGFSSWRLPRLLSRQESGGSDAGQLQMFLPLPILGIAIVSRSSVTAFLKYLRKKFRQMRLNLGCNRNSKVGIKEEEEDDQSYLDNWGY
jgi:hypothetical protein